MIKKYMKYYKNRIISVLILILFCLVLLNIAGNQNLNTKTYIVKTNYIPEENNIYLDTKELSFFINPLVYPSILDENQNKILAKNIKIEQNIISVKFKDDIAKIVKESYLNLSKNICDKSFKCENIDGWNTDDICIEIIDENTLSFKVNDINNLDFLTVPIIGNVGEFYISEYIPYTSFTIKNNKNIEFKIMLEPSETVDIYLTNINETKDGYEKEIIGTLPEYIVICNYDNKINEIKNLYNGINSDIEDVKFWSNASHNATLISEKFKENAQKQNISFSIDYCEDFYLYKLFMDGEKFICYTENIDNFVGADFIEIPIQNIYLNYNNDVKKIIERYF